MTRPIWLPIASIIMAVLVWAILFGYVHAAVHPDTTMPSIRPEKALESDKAKP